MHGQENADREEREPQAPKFMRPQRPVLDEPLEDSVVPEKPEEDQGAPENLPKINMPLPEATQETKLGPAPLVEPETSGHSPYFPRGIYEDAQSVEAYYGRGESEKVSEKSTAQETLEDYPTANPFLRWWLAALAVVLILALLLLTLTQGIPLNLF